MKKPIDAIKKKLTSRAKSKAKKKSQKSSILKKVEKKPIKNFRPTKKQLLILGIIGSVLVLYLIFCVASSISLAGRIYPNVFIGSINLSNSTAQQAQEILSQKSKTYLADAKIEFISKDKSFSFKPKNVAAKIEIDKTIQSLLEIGHNQNFLAAGLIRLRLIFKPINQTAVVSFNQDKWSDFVDKIAEQVNIPFQNAGLKIDNKQIVETPSSIGAELEKSSLELQVKNTIGVFQTNPITLSLVLAFPKIQAEDTAWARQEAEKMISSPIQIIYKDRKFLADVDLIGSWINFAEASKEKVLGAKTDQNPVSTTISNSDLTLIAQLDETKVKKYIDEVAQQIDIAPQNAGLFFSNGRLSVVSPSVTGRAINKDKLYADITTAAGSESFRKITIKIVTTVPDVREDNLAKLGIVELIGEGISSFGGSPRNRIHNIKNGATKFNGVLIKPDQVFSFNENLGKVNAATGYLPELVIKENKTVPEFGGGLCQVSTTTFRAALLSGLPIIERKPHAYRVRYYDWPYGPGVDATVYQPNPDLKFKNDTGHWILIQTSASGSRLTFSFYGTSGGRSATISKPTILWSKPDGSMATVFTRQVFQNGVLVRTDPFNSKFKSPALFPHPVVENGAPAAAPAPAPTQ